MDIPKVRLCPDCGTELVSGPRSHAAYRRCLKWECNNPSCHLISVEWRYKKKKYRVFEVVEIRESLGIEHR